MKKKVSWKAESGYYRFNNVKVDYVKAGFPELGSMMTA